MPVPTESDDSLPLDQRDELVFRLSLERFGSAFRTLDGLIVLINHGTAALSGSRHDRGLAFLIGLLSVRAFNSIWQGRQSAAHGYPVQAMVAARAALEDWATVRWLEENPDDKDLWLCRILEEVAPPLDAQGRERWVPKIDSMLKSLDNGAVALVAYEQMSKLAHPRGSGLAWEFHADEGNAYIHAGGHLDERNLRAALFYLIHVAAGLLPSVERLQRLALGDVDPEWLTRGNDAVNEALAFISEVGD